MKTAILIGILILSLIVIGFFIVGWFNLHSLCKNFDRCNVIVDGKKGTGKDLLFQAVIHCRKKKYLSNLDYGYKLDKILTPKDISVSPNTYLDFIQNKVKKIDLTLPQKEDIYLSDGGVYLPSTYDSTLNRLFPSFPIYYALNRHLTMSNIHVNVQNLGRLWKQLREQADYYVHMRGCIHILGLFILRYTTYDRCESALLSLRPLPSRLFNGFSRAESDQFTALHGEIKDGFIIVRKKSIKYDTRAFYKILVNRSYEECLNSSSTPEKRAPTSK